MTQKSKNKWLAKENRWIVFSTIHLLLSFVYERIVLKFDSSEWNIFWSVAKTDTYSNSFQSAVLYVSGKVIAAILIGLFWYVALKALRGGFPRHIVVLFLVSFFVLGFYFYLFLPTSFFWKDTFTLYGFAVRLIPWYWHHYLTSAWFIGCLMVFPHPFMISLIQLVGFVAMMTYLYYRMEKSFRLPTWCNLMIYLVLLAPETFWLIAFPYRNCIYAIILMFYVAFLLMENIDRAKFSVGKMLVVCFLSALLSVWRTEGILVGIIGIALCIFKIYAPSNKKKLVCFMIYIAIFMLLGAPQKIGDKQYYGKDYLIASTIEPLKNILNDKNANLSYEGALEDLENISELAPLKYIMYDGKNSLNAYFFKEGHIDFDQTLASEELQGRYLKSFIRVLLHNIPTYLKTQLNFATSSLNLSFEFEMDGYEGEPFDISYDYNIDEVGTLDYMRMASPFIGNSVQVFFATYASLATVSYREFNEKLGITAILRVLILLADLYICIFEFIRLLKRDKKADIVSFFMAGLFLAQFVIVVMTIPMVLDKYFYSIFFPCLVLECIYLFHAISNRREIKR